MYTIGVGPSSSHTVGPMRAAWSFSQKIIKSSSLSQVKRLQIVLYGSLALTGKGHATDKAVLMGLSGELPELIDPQLMPEKLENIKNSQEILLGGVYRIDFFEPTDLLFNMNHRLPLHSNGMQFYAYDSFGKVVACETYYSIGGGFVLTEDELQKQSEPENSEPVKDLNPHAAFEFETMADLYALQKEKGLLSFLHQREDCFRQRKETTDLCLKIWVAMKACASKGLTTSGILPGGLLVKRRAPALWSYLQENKGRIGPSESMEWISVYALAVNEENAAGGRVVTAPTNGAAGVIPSVLHYLIFHELEGSSVELEAKYIEHFLLVAGAIGLLYKKGASISAAEMGCQGEIGVASSMAAAGYTAVMGGSIEQIEAAAEIAMEHHLGMTCDPVAGLVQIPCIERNTMGAVKAITAARLALRGDGKQKVSLDQVIRTMLQTGKDMSHVYKETSLGGLAVNVVAC
jgi:L-serine dehydratase